jgi:hypothetical protein
MHRWLARYERDGLEGLKNHICGICQLGGRQFAQVAQNLPKKARWEDPLRADKRPSAIG